MENNFIRVFKHFIDKPVTDKALVDFATFMIAYANIIMKAPTCELREFANILENMRQPVKNIVEFSVFQYTLLNKKMSALKGDECGEMYKAFEALQDEPFLKPIKDIYNEED